MNNEQHLYQLILTSDEYNELIKAIELSSHIVNTKYVIGEKIDNEKLNAIKEKIITLA